MGIYAERMEYRAGVERSFLENPAEWVELFFGAGGRSSTGRIITPMLSMRDPGVYACVKAPSEDLGSLPFLTYEHLAIGGKDRAPEHSLFPILSEAPNDEMDAMQFVETMQAWSEIWPAAYAEIVRDEGGDVVGLWPIHPDLVTPLRIKTLMPTTFPEQAGRYTPELCYRIQLPSGQTAPDGSTWRILARENIFKLRGLSLDGVEGIGVARTHAESIGLSLALTEYSASYFGNGVHVGAVMSTPHKLSDKAYARLLKAWEARHQGLSNAHRMAILEEGLSLNNEQRIQNDQAQLDQSKHMSIETLARIFRIPPHIVQELTRSTNNNIEHQGIEYVQYSLRSRAVRWERAVSMQILTPTERKRYFCEFMLDAFLRGDSASEATMLGAMRLNGVINADEWRARKNMNPLPDGQGKVYVVPVNVQTLERLIAPPVVPGLPGAPAPTPAPAGGDVAELETEVAGTGAVPESSDSPQNDTAARALLPLFTDSLGRALRNEAKSAQAAAKLGMKKFEEWARKYYGAGGERELMLRSTLEPLVTAAAMLVAKDADAVAHAVSGYVSSSARRHCEAALEEIATVVPANTTDPAAAVEALALRWSGKEVIEARARVEFDWALRLAGVKPEKEAA